MTSSIRTPGYNTYYRFWTFILMMNQILDRSDKKTKQQHARLISKKGKYLDYQRRPNDQVHVTKSNKLLSCMCLKSVLNLHTKVCKWTVRVWKNFDSAG